MTDSVAWVPTHTAPEAGMACWAAPDPATALSARLDRWLPVRVLETAGAWARVQCSNGWAAWVDGRLLLALPELPPPAASPPQPSAAALRQAQVVARLQAVLDVYRAALAELAAGRIDMEAFRHRVIEHGLAVVDGEAWILDLDGGRWWRYDGIRLVAADAAVPVPAMGMPR